MIGKIALAPQVMCGRCSLNPERQPRRFGIITAWAKYWFVFDVGVDWLSRCEWTDLMPPAAYCASGKFAAGYIILKASRRKRRGD